MMRKFFFAGLFSCFFLLALHVQGTYAAGASIDVSPKNGSYRKPFTVNISVDGQGNKFNAAQANVKVSTNLAVKDVTLGNCNFSFLHTPTVQNPSFAGIIISASSPKCIVYSLTVVPTTKGSATISLTKGSIKQYGTAAELFSLATDGSYSLTAVSSPATLGTNTSQNGLYTLYLKVYSSGTTPAANAQVALNSVSKTNHLQETTDNTGTAHFSNLQEGVYDATVTEGWNKVGETILNVTGKNHVLTLAMDISAQKNNPLMKLGSLLSNLASNPLLLVGTLVIGIIVGVGVALLVLNC